MIFWNAAKESKKNFPITLTTLGCPPTLWEDLKPYFLPVNHPLIKGYLFKVYLDVQPDICEWSNWVRRIEGAHAIRACIKRHGYKHFSVPHKWIYPLPPEPSPPFSEKYHRKNFILIVEDMHIVNLTQNPHII